MKRLLLLVAAALAAAPATAAPRPVVVELFTSQACSSCPPADALLRRLAARDPGLLVLDLHVTYWNDAAYRDPYALPAATARQDWYARLGHTNEVYTPQAVIDGQTRLVGSRAGAMRAAILAARARAAPAVSIHLDERNGRLTIALGAGPHAGAPARVVAFGYDPSHTTAVGGGENAGATLTEIDVVRGIATVGSWNGAAARFALKPPAGQRVAVLVQAADGTVLGAARR